MRGRHDLALCLLARWVETRSRKVRSSIFDPRSSIFDLRSLEPNCGSAHGSTGPTTTGVLSILYSPSSLESRLWESAADALFDPFLRAVEKRPQSLGLDGCIANRFAQVGPPGVPVLRGDAVGNSI